MTQINQAQIPHSVLKPGKVYKCETRQLFTNSEYSQWSEVNFFMGNHIIATGGNIIENTIDNQLCRIHTFDSNGEYEFIIHDIGYNGLIDVFIGDTVSQIGKTVSISSHTVIIGNDYSSVFDLSANGGNVIIRYPIEISESLYGGSSIDTFDDVITGGDSSDNTTYEEIDGGTSSGIY